MTQVSVHHEEQFKRSPVTDQLIDFLKKIPEGGKVPYGEMCALVHVDVQRKCRHFLDSARLVLVQEYNMVFVSERNYGLTRLRNEEIAGYANRLHKRRLKQDTKRYKEKLEAVDPQKLSGSAAHDYHAGIIIASLREVITSKPVERKIQQSSQGTPPQVDEDGLLKQIKSLKFG
ncbi:MAG: hypothetical protein AAFX78_05000 [Cyanobacteria bacterium J06638_20]